MTELLKKWLVDNCDVKADASDDEFKKAMAEAMVSGKLTPEKYAKLAQDPVEKEANEFATKLDAVIDGIGKLTEAMTKKEEPKEEKKTEEKKETPEVKDLEGKETGKMVGELGGTPDDPSDEKAFNIRVKEAVEHYDNTKGALVYPEKTHRDAAHPLAGMPVSEFGRTKTSLSIRDKALAGSWAKFAIQANLVKSTQIAYDNLPQHDKELLHYLCDKTEWDDITKDNGATRMGYPGGVKQLIDDGGASGGLEAAPIVFDDMVIETPLLYGELFPLVNVVPIDRGRRIEGVTVGQVTGAWGGVDDTAITLFNTTAYVAAFDTSIYRWEGSIHVGLDFLSDTPIDFGQLISRQYGNELMRQLDIVVAVGNGTTQPQGVMNSGATAVAWGGATTLGNYESLRFGVAKPEHSTDMRRTAVFCGTETSYQRAMAIPVGAADVRRIFGMDYDGYSIMNRKYAINESLTNAQIFYAILGRYRMYRRRGFVLRSSTEGDTLIRQNELLIAVMARYGGQMERAAAASLTTTAPA